MTSTELQDMLCTLGEELINQAVILADKANKADEQGLNPTAQRAAALTLASLCSVVISVSKKLPK